jgi:hypothetical protein
MSRLPHFLDSWLTDCGEVQSLTRRSTKKSTWAIIFSFRQSQASCITWTALVFTFVLTLESSAALFITLSVLPIAQPLNRFVWKWEDL